VVDILALPRTPKKKPRHSAKLPWCAESSILLGGEALCRDPLRIRGFAQDPGSNYGPKTEPDRLGVFGAEKELRLWIWSS
jgi:hypothetical protein